MKILNIYNNKIQYYSNTKYYDTASVIPGELHSILIGIMLSDGGLHRSSPTANTRLEMSFGEKYKSLAFHIGELFKEYMSNPVKSLEVKGVNKVYTNYTNYRNSKVSS